MSQQWDLHYDVVVVGAGPAGLAAAITLKQQSPELGVCVLEKGAYCGAHQISGALVPQDLLAELFTQGSWSKAPPAMTPVTRHHWWLLGKRWQLTLPEQLLPKALRPQEPLAILSLGALCQWLGDEAVVLGVDLFTSQSVVAGCYDHEALVGVRTGELGRQPDGSPGPQYCPGIRIGAHLVLVAEGACGSLTRELTARFDLQGGAAPRHYALGFKERWQLPAGRMESGAVYHTLGWPVASAGGGGFAYGSGEDTLELGWVVPLEHGDGKLDPYACFEQFKQHSAIAPWLEGATRLGFGARTLSEGGWQGLGRLSFPGGALLGCAAGLLDLRRQQGVAPAIISGRLAALQAIPLLRAGDSARDPSMLTPADPPPDLGGYDRTVRTGPLGQALRQAAAIKPVLARLGSYLGAAYLAMHYGLWQWGIKLPCWSLPRHSALLRRERERCFGESYDFSLPAVAEPSLLLAREAALFQANIAVGEGPCHLHYQGSELGSELGSECADPLLTRLLPATCPAGVYHYHQGKWHLQPENCLHCKACEARDPSGKVCWTPPDAGSGPRYQQL